MKTNVQTANGRAVGSNRLLAIPSRETVISDMLHELELVETTYTVLSQTERLPDWLKKKMKEERRRTRRVIKHARAVGILE